MCNTSIQLEFFRSETGRSRRSLIVLLYLSAKKATRYVFLEQWFMLLFF